MSIPDIVDRFVEFSYFLSNILVFGFATVAYQKSRKRGFLMIAVSAAIAAVLAVASSMRADKPSWAFWSFHTVATICDLYLYVVGFWLLSRDYLALPTRSAQPDAAPNGGQVAPSANSDVTGGPPSVS
jgi:hypothetical protein